MANLHAFGDKIMGGGSTGGGHTIWNRIKTALTQRSKLWFKDATVSDVSADGASAVEVLTSISESDFDNLATDGTADGIYEMNSSDVTPLMADNIGYGSGTVADALDGIVVAESSTNQTYGTQLVSLQSAYSALNSNQKMKAKLYMGDFHMWLRDVTDAGLFSSTYYGETDGKAYILQADITSGHLFSINLSTNSATDISSWNDSMKIKLII